MNTMCEEKPSKKHVIKICFEKTPDCQMESCFYHRETIAKHECIVCSRKMCEIDAYFVDEREKLTETIEHARIPSSNKFPICGQCFIKKISRQIKRQSMTFYTIGITILVSAIALSPLLISAMLTRIEAFAKVLIGLSYLLLFSFSFLFIRRATVERKRIQKMIEDNGIDSKRNQ